jgi:hypothetical protein
MGSGITSFIKKHSSTFACIIAAGGVAATAVLTAKGTPKALELLKQSEDEGLSKKDTFVKVAPAYIPAAVCGTLTIACIFGANMLNKRQRIALIGAYAAAKESYKAYKSKVIEVCGKETHERIMRELAVEKAADTHIYTPNTFADSASSLEFEDADEELHLFYDSFSDRYFESTFSRVLMAEMAINRNAQLGMPPTLNNFYELLGLEKIENGDETGWSLYSGEYMWIDFNHIKITLEDDIPCWIIECTALCEPTEWDEY